MKKRKVLYLHTTAIKPGKANLTQVAQMCNAFLNNNCELTLAIPKSEVSKKEAIDILIKKFNVNPNINIEFISNVTNIDVVNKYTYHLRVRKIIRRIQPDFCFVRNPFFLLSCNWWGIPAIYESHNSLTHEGSKLLNRLISGMLIRLSRSKKTLRFITISKALADFWKEKGVPAEKIIALHDGFNSASFEQLIKKDEAREKINYTLDKKLIVYTGSLNPERGIDQLLYVAEKLPDCHFHILGGPKKFEDYYSASAHENGLKNVEFKGFVEHSVIHHYLYAADVLLAIWTSKVKTINYCSPLKLFEYMASGRTTVVSGFPTIKEVVSHEENALIAKPDDKEDLLSKAKQALTYSEPSSIGINARKLAFQEYNWDCRVNTILKSTFNSYD